MGPKPVIFISSVSKELHSARDLVAKTLAFLGYDADWQDIFGTEQGNLKGMLCRHIDAADGVIQLVGHCHGFEPVDPDVDFGRVSYTQYEALYAQQCGKKVWFILLDDAFQRDAHAIETEERRKMQASYRERVRAQTRVWYPAANNTELENRIHGLRNDLARLRRRFAQWAVAVLALLLVTVLVGGLLLHGQHEVRIQNDMLLASMRDLPATLFQVTQAGVGEDEANRLSRAYVILDARFKLPPGTLEKELPKFAERMLQLGDTSALDRASAFFALGKFAAAEAAATAAKDKALAVAGQPVKDAVNALLVAGQAARAQINYTRALEYFKTAASLTDEKRDAVEWAHVQGGVALVLLDIGRCEEAADVLKHVIQTQQDVLGFEHPETLASRNNFANALRGQGKYAEAETEHRTRIRIEQRIFGSDHPQTLWSRINLANALSAQGKRNEAEVEYRAVLSIVERVGWKEHRLSLASRNNLASLLIDQGRYAEAEAECRAVISVVQRRVGPDHPDTLKTRCNLAVSLNKQKKYLEAEAELREILPIQQRVMGLEHADTLVTRDNLALSLEGEGKCAEAEAEHRAVVLILERVRGMDHPATLQSREHLAIALDDQQKFVEAEREFRAVLALRQRIVGPEHPDYLNSCFNLAICLRRQGKNIEALALARLALAGQRKAIGMESHQTRRTEALVKVLEATVAIP